MKLKKLREEEVEEREPEGLSDGGHTLLSCSNCNAILVDVWTTNPNMIDPTTGKVFEWKLRAKCPFCEDRSFPQTIKGGFHFGGYGKVKKDDENDDIPSTSVSHFETEGDTVVFHVLKARPDAKPIKRR